MNLTGEPAGSLERCPGCAALLPAVDGPTHRYIGASAACWAIYTALGVGEPPIAPRPLGALLVDAYAAQHPGTPSDQSIQSVAVHLIAMHGVLVRGETPERALALRQRALREQVTPKRGRFVWLEPPQFDGSLTVKDIADARTPDERAVTLERYVREVWSRWAATYASTVAGWYERFVLPERV